MNDRIILNKWLRWGLIFTLGIVARFILDVVYSLMYRNYFLFQPIKGYLFAILITFGIFETVRMIKNRLDKNKPWDSNPYRRFVVQLLSAVGVGLFYAGILRWIVEFLFIRISYINFDDELVIVVLVVVGTTALTVFDLGVYLLRKWRFSLAELERFKKENAEFQFETLRSQVNPHFLFNSLNTLSALVFQDQEKAGLFIRELSDVYRYILENRNKELVNLEEELKVARSYIYLVQLRFEQRLNVIIDIPENMKDAMIAPLTLQLLIENAVKHNVISKNKPLTIKVYTDDNWLVVLNNLQKKEVHEFSSELGLKNIRSRYQFLSSNKVEVIENASEFKVRIPLIKAL